MEIIEKPSGGLDVTDKIGAASDEAAQLQEAIRERDAIARQLDALEVEVSSERNRPWAQLRRYLAFRVLTSLSRFSPPLPTRTAARFARSAFKKDPNRLLADRDLAAITPDAQLSGQGWTEYPGGQAQDPAKKNILIVSHDSSLTGAPILALNLIQGLSARYNVTALILRRGDILDEFKASATTVYAATKVGSAAYGRLIGTICRNRTIAFAAVNSAESHAALKHLRAEGVTTVSLLHEFASYVRPNARGRSAFAEIFEASSEVVFSTRLTLEAAKEQNPLVNMSKAHVLPQGKCLVPRAKGLAANSEAEKAWLRAMLRPDGPDDKRIVVIGAGTVNLRKGVDLFIEMATRVLKMAGGAEVSFFWIGPNYDPDQDRDYSSYLRDQMKRAGVGQHMTMLRETTEIELAYSLADIFVLSSRLDPLPNVTIDAMSVGLPVICFENTSGIADLLADAGLKETCVAHYIDTHDMADKVFALATNPKLHAEISARSRVFAAEAFDFDSYARKIEALGLNRTKTLAAS